MSGIVVTAGVPSTAATTVTRDAAARMLWDLHYRHLAGYVAVLLSDIDGAHDIASEAFTRLLSKWVYVRDPKAYLYVTASNLVRDRWRREQRERKLQERLEQSAETSTPGAGPTLRDLVEGLPDRMRLPVLLHYYADMPVAQIAAQLHRPEGSVKRHLYDARHALRSMLEVDA